MQKERFPVVKDEFVFDEDLADLDKSWEQLAEELLGETADNRKCMIEEFRARIEDDKKLFGWMMKDESRFLCVRFLTRFLRAGGWEIKSSLQVLRNYSCLGREYPGIISLAIPNQLNIVWEKKLNSILEERDAFGRRIYIFRLGMWDPKTVPINQFYASAFVLFELLSREVKTQIAGVTVIADISNFGSQHISCLGLEQIKCIAAFLTGSMPVWFRRIHVVNHPRVFNLLYTMMKPSLVPRVSQNIIFHGSDFKKLHLEVPQNNLPEFLGGSGDMENGNVVRSGEDISQDFQTLINHLID
ncbi:alpha-tocopherol transfer protein [Eurytemora carolleeae]|uniref:alpha-tocopherol transfer protein n=1 Tax=Eurytemora carolleeae TaxID=1294199 RepID=UPI000C7798EB|nr:alpha-tocopherol transfer protein [Eurytemora carolleeae]|eukprot:XP_023326685.1 alpha-tocopherol transfer protein-like [Eurytemora affinis]